VIDQRLQAICDLIQEDVVGRGLRSNTTSNLVTATAGHFQAACRSLAHADNPVLAVVTGFIIPTAEPPRGETDGPLGALFLARALTPLGIRVVLASDLFCVPALRAGLAACGLESAVPVVTLPTRVAGSLDEIMGLTPHARLTHLLALERVGPSHTPASLRAQPGGFAFVEEFLREVPAHHHDRCHTMRGRDITELMSPAHLLFEVATTATPRITTLGIGDGGNEIGMGTIPWDVIRRNIPNGGMIACRVPVDHLIVCGLSNWGAYGLAAGVSCLRGQRLERALFDLERERELLRIMVEQGPLVDGVSGLPTVSVDGLTFERYVEPLRRLGEIV
jgi:hypothetical protein